MSTMIMLRRAALALGLAMPALPAMAEDAPPASMVVARLAGPMLAAQQAIIKLREAERDVLTERVITREKEWAESFAAWCGGRSACGLEAAPPSAANEPDRQ